MMTDPNTPEQDFVSWLASKASQSRMGHGIAEDAATTDDPDQAFAVYLSEALDGHRPDQATPDTESETH